MKKLTNQDDHDLLLGLHEKMDAVTKAFKDHESRLRHIESDGQKYKGAAAILIFVIGAVEPLLIWRLNK